MQSLAPIGNRDRIDVLDVLRGFALFGVLWANVLWFFSGYGDLTPDERLNLSSAFIDPAVLKFETFFVVNKFISIFSFLFGVGFALQIRRATDRGAIVNPFFVRRMFWLFVFGAVHGLFIWYGDILHLYAILGIFLLGRVFTSDRKLVIWGLAFAVLLPSAIRAAIWTMAWATDGGVNLNEGFELRWQAASELRTAFVHGSYPDVVRANAADIWAWLSTDDAATTGAASFGRFLLGFWAGRAGILAMAASRETTTRREMHALLLVRHGLVYGGLIGLASQGATYLLAGDSWQMTLAKSLLWDMGVLALAASYVCGIVLLFRIPAWRKRLFYFAPVGRMALTNYLGQSVICVFLFYGFGLEWSGKVGPAGSLAVSLGVFTVQAFISTWWLRRFRFGPAEWVWRSLTYGNRQAFSLPNTT